MLVVVAVLFLLNFCAFPSAMYSFICYLYIFANSGFFINFFSKDSNLFKASSVLKGSWGCSSHQGSLTSKWPSFNEVVVSKIFKECFSSGFHDNWWCWGNVPYDSTSQNCFKSFDKVLMDLLLKELQFFSWSDDIACVVTPFLLTLQLSPIIVYPKSISTASGSLSFPTLKSL